MDGFDVKEVMEQVHISSKMQEEIIMNLQNQMEHGHKNGMKKRNQKAWSWKKTAAAAAFMLVAGIVSFPVQAMVKNIVMARMESIPEEETQKIVTVLNVQEVHADGLTREYTEYEEERSKELWQAYENGMFPENVIQQVDDAEEVTEGTLCYIRTTGDFYLPDREMTDEEMLEIIDFQHQMSYAIEQSPAAAEARAEYLAEEARLEAMVQDADGISGEEAVEIARKQLESDLGGRAGELELMTDYTGNGATLMDISDISGELESSIDAVYDVGFGDGSSSYGYIIDAVDGSILSSWSNIPD